MEENNKRTTITKENNMNNNNEGCICSLGAVDRKEMDKCREIYGELLSNGELCIACFVKVETERKTKNKCK